MKKCLLALACVLGLACAAEATAPVFVPARAFGRLLPLPRRVLVPVEPVRAAVFVPAAIAPQKVFLGFDRFGRPVYGLR